MPPHPGGLELVVANLVEGLRERDHDVRWIASATPLAPGVDGPLIRVRAFTRLEDWFSVPLPFWGPSALKQLLAQIRWADVVHVHDCLYPGSAAAVAIARSARTPVLMTQHIAQVPYHNRIKDTLQEVAYNTTGRAVVEAVDKVVTYSPHVQDYFRKLGISKNLELIPLGFDERFAAPTAEDRVQWRKKYGIAQDAQVVVFAARLVAKKGVAEVAEVQRVLGQQGVTLLVAGDGPERNKLDGLLHVRHLPQVPYAEMHAIYGLSDALLLPSRGEGLPLTVQEGMLTGLPVVVSTDPSYLANLKNTPGASLCGDTEGLINATRAYLASPPPRLRIAEWAKNTWGKERFIGGYERAFQQVLERNRVR